MNLWVLRAVQAITIFFIVIGNWALEPYVSSYLFGLLQVICVIGFITATVAKFAIRRDPEGPARRKTEAFLKLEEHKRATARPVDEVNND